MSSKQSVRDRVPKLTNGAPYAVHKISRAVRPASTRSGKSNLLSVWPIACADGVRYRGLRGDWHCTQLVMKKSRFHRPGIWLFRKPPALQARAASWACGM